MLKNRNLFAVSAANIAMAAAMTGLVLAASCTKKEEAVTAPADSAAAPQAAAPAAAVDPSKATVTLEIGSDGDAMAYNKTTLKCKAGEIVKLVFTNNSKSSNLQHNWVLVQAGKESDVDQAGIAAGQENGWIPQGHPAVIAHTKLVDPGQSETIYFQAPTQKGEVPYICTFPGHSMVMKGKLIVE
jgi:azurin